METEKRIQIAALIDIPLDHILREGERITLGQSAENYRTTFL
jgi:hypothetical protein